MIREWYLVGLNTSKGRGTSENRIQDFDIDNKHNNVCMWWTEDKQLLVLQIMKNFSTLLYEKIQLLQKKLVFSYAKFNYGNININTYIRLIYSSFCYKHENKIRFNKFDNLNYIMY